MLVVAFNEVMLVLVLFLPGIYFLPQSTSKQQHIHLDKILLIGVTMVGVIAMVLFATGMLHV